MHGYRKDIVVVALISVVPKIIQSERGGQSIKDSLASILKIDFITLDFI